MVNVRCVSRLPRLPPPFCTVRTTRIPRHHTTRSAEKKKAKKAHKPRKRKVVETAAKKGGGGRERLARINRAHVHLLTAAWLLSFIAIRSLRGAAGPIEKSLSIIKKLISTEASEIEAGG